MNSNDLKKDGVTKPEKVGTEAKVDEDLIGDADLGEDEDFEISNYGAGNTEDDLFDSVVGTLQEIVIEEEFEELQREFLDQNCDIFENTEENKMEYWPIFKKYQKDIESFLEAKLKERIPELDMKGFFDMLSVRSDQIDSQLLDTLLSFTDFQQFKELMLDHKKFKKTPIKGAAKKGKAQSDNQLESATAKAKKEKEKASQQAMEDQFADMLICTPARSTMGTNKKKEKTKASEDNIFAANYGAQTYNSNIRKKPF